jgi:xylose isomerase
MGGFTTGGTELRRQGSRRESFEPVDLFHAHIAGMDTFARGLKIARPFARRRLMNSSANAIAPSTAVSAGKLKSAKSASRNWRITPEDGRVTTNQSGRQE